MNQPTIYSILAAGNIGCVIGQQEKCNCSGLFCCSGSA
jgi:hypothetical protein